MSNFKQQLSDLRKLLNYGLEGGGYTLLSSPTRNQLYILFYDRHIAGIGDKIVRVDRNLAQHPMRWIFERFAEEKKLHFTLANFDYIRNPTYFTNQHWEFSVTWDTKPWPGRMLAEATTAVVPPTLGYAEWERIATQSDTQLPRSPGPQLPGVTYTYSNSPPVLVDEEMVFMSLPSFIDGQDV